jgi:hypothetical protein
MTLLVTGATGANGAGYGKILAFGDDPHIADPRGLGIDRIDSCSSSTAAQTEFSRSTTTEWLYGRVELWTD